MMDGHKMEKMKARIFSLLNRQGRKSRVIRTLACFLFLVPFFFPSAQAACTWSQGSFGNTNNCLTDFTNGTFFMIGCGGGTNYLYYSTNGTTWTNPNLSGTLSSNGRVSYGNGIWLVTDSTNFLYSTDLSSWTRIAVPSGFTNGGAGNSTSLFTNGSFFSTCGGYACNLMFYSADAATWNSTAMTGTGWWRSMAFGNGVFVALENNSGLVNTSTSGTSGWAAGPTLGASYGQWNSLVFAKNKFWAMADGMYVSSSSDGRTWSTPVAMQFTNGAPSGAAAGISSLRYDAASGIFMAFYGYSGTNAIIYSGDGLTWTTETVNKSWFRGPSIANGLIVAGGSGQIFYYTSASCLVVPLTCDAGYYSSDGTTCICVGEDYWSAGGVTMRTACVAGTKSAGCGTAAAAATDCVAYKTLKNSKNGTTALMRAVKMTTPSVCVSSGGTKYYGNLTTSAVTGAVKLNVGGVVYYVTNNASAQ